MFINEKIKLFIMFAINSFLCFFNGKPMRYIEIIPYLCIILKKIFEL